MSRFVFIAMLAIVATTSAKPQVYPYATGYYGGYISPSYYNYPYYSYPYTPVTYVETVPITPVVSAPPAVPIVPAKFVAKNARQADGPPPPLPEQELPVGPPAGPPPPAAPPAGPVKVIIVKKSLPDPAKLLAALPIAQLLELPPVKKIVALKTSKLETIMALKGALQAKLAPIAALLP